MLKIRQSRDRLILNMGIPYLGKTKDGLVTVLSLTWESHTWERQSFVETGPWTWYWLKIHHMYLSAESHQFIRQLISRCFFKFLSFTLWPFQYTRPCWLPSNVASFWEGHRGHGLVSVTTISSVKLTWVLFQYQDHLPMYPRIPVINLRWSNDRLILVIGIPVFVLYMLLDGIFIGHGWCTGHLRTGGQPSNTYCDDMVQRKSSVLTHWNLDEISFYSAFSIESGEYTWCQKHLILISFRHVCSYSRILFVTCSY